MSGCKNWKEMKDVGKPKKWQDVPMGGIAYGASAENVENWPMEKHSSRME